jgi:hypothetical protein
LDLAQKIADIDPAMATFRAITGEEEAASGLMHCLKERGYSNAKLLDPRSHVHKNSVIPFFSILGDFHGPFFKAHNIKPIFHIKSDCGKRRLTIGIPMVINGEPHHAYPIPPLNFGMKIEEKPPSYKKQISEYVESNGAKDILSHLRQEANARNEILYASDEGFPVIHQMRDGFLELRQARVFAMLRAYLFIAPYNEIQPFVQDALDAFLAMLGSLKVHDLNEEV